MPRRGHPGAAAGRPLPGALPITIRHLSKMLLSKKIVSNRAKGFRASRYQVPVVSPPCLWSLLPPFAALSNCARQL